MYDDYCNLSIPSFFTFSILFSLYLSVANDDDLYKRFDKPKPASIYPQRPTRRARIDVNKLPTIMTPLMPTKGAGFISRASKEAAARKVCFK